MRIVTVEAPGKVNLTLEILGKRPDGYHELRSILMPVSLFETVTVRERADGVVTLRTTGEGVDCTPSHRRLVWQAARVARRFVRPCLLGSAWVSLRWAGREEDLPFRLLLQNGRMVQTCDAMSRRGLNKSSRLYEWRYSIACSHEIGMRTSKVDLLFGMLSTEMLPPCSSTMRLQSVSPRPLPSLAWLESPW